MFHLFKKKATVSPKRPLYIFNTLTRKKEEFVPIKKGAATMYTCGPTVYDYVHIGNLAAYTYADLLKRTLRYNGYHVRHTMNLTDVGHLTSDNDEGEDKMMIALRRAKKPKTLTAMREVSDVFINSFMEDIAEMRIEPPTQYTRASDFIGEQMSLIETLADKGYTYETSDGIYFDISKFPSYGKLGNIDLEKLKEGARVEVNPEKRHPADFALWKKGLLGWESPWGKGFPGWHIECTAMAFATLGKQIDIHTGGEDLKYTHHNGEIAQAEAATGKSPYVRYWFHNAFISIDNTKISKSLGNTVGLRQLLERGYKGDVYRYWLLTGHYRSTMNFTWDALDGAKHALFRLKRHLFEECLPASAKKRGTVNSDYQKQFQEALNDDLNTPKAIALIWKLVKDETVCPEDTIATLRDMDSVLSIGLSDEPAEAIRELGVIEPEEIPAEIQTLIDEREAARVARNWDEADRLREAINLKGYTLEDTPHGPRISKA